MNKTITKAMKYKINKQTNATLTRKEFNTILFNIQNETRTMLNKTIQINYEWLMFSVDYFQEHGEYPKLSEIKGYKMMQGYVYNNLKNKCSLLGTSSLSSVIKTSCDRFKSDKKEILRGDKTIPYYKKNPPIEIAKSDISIYKNEGNYFVKLALLNTKARKNLDMKSGQFDLLLDCGKKSNTPKSILDKIIAGEYSHNTSKIEWNNGSWYFILTYTHEISDAILLDSKRTLGVDLGIKYVAYSSVYDSNKNKYDWIKNGYIEGGEIKQFRDKIEARRKSMLKQSKYCGDGRKGHGRKTLLKPIEKLNGKVDNFRKTCNHRYSRYIVDLAVKNNCGNIVMENLSGIGETSEFLKSWSYYELQQMVAYKAKEYNINVSFINPKYTSQRCSECGHIHKDNRETQEKFTCKNCGYTDNADKNASKNIAYPNIEELINDYVDDSSDVKITKLKERN